MERITPTPLILIISLVIGAASTPASGEEEQPPNILWIAGENISLDLGCYGQENVHTPNLDRLAADGARYTNVYSTAPVCAPSRAALMTGFYQTTTGMHPMPPLEYDLPPGVSPLTHRLQDVGYFTANVTHIGDEKVGTGKLGVNFADSKPIFQSDDWSKLKANQPFFAQISTPEAEFDIYGEDLAEQERVEWVGEEIHPKIATPENVNPPPYYPDHKIVRREWARYLNSVSGLDRRVGRVLKQLKKEGMMDRTVIFFFADNGRLEARGIHWVWDSGLHVPMILHWPKNYPAPPQYRAGKKSDRLISLLDLTATTLSIAGIDPTPPMQSRVFLGEDADPPRKFVFSARDRIDATDVHLRSVHSKRYHYIRNYTSGAGFPTMNRYKEKCFPVKPLMRRLNAEGKLTGAAERLMEPLPKELLYNTKQDPHEIHNLASSNESEHQKALIRMRAALQTWITETGDVGREPEPVERLQQVERQMHEWFGTPPWYDPTSEKSASTQFGNARTER